MTPFDRLIAFCSSTGKASDKNLKQYYFQRHDSTSPTSDYSTISRNQQLYKYLQNLTDRNVPGFGGKFTEKYSHSDERDQILTEIVDYIRCTNLWDHSVKDTDPNNPTIRFTPRSNNPATGGGQVVPLRIGSTQGLGRMYTISEIGLLLICTADGNGSNEDLRTKSNTKSNPTLADNFGGETKVLDPKQKRLQAMLLIELTCPMQGFDTIMPDISINIKNLNNIMFGITKTDVRTPFPTGDVFTESPGTRFNGIIQTGGLNGFQYFLSRLDWGNNLRRSAWSNPNTTYPYRFVSNPFTVPTSDTGDGSLSIETSAPITVEIQVKQKGNGTQRRVAQTFKVNFPITTVPLPDLIQTGTNGSSKSDASDWWGFDNRIQWASSSIGSPTAADKGSVIRTDASGIPDSTTIGSAPSDVVRSIAAKAGDVRLIMAKETVTADGTTDMVMTPGYNSTAKLAHTFMQALGSNLVPGVNLGGKLVPGADYEKAWVPKVPSDVTPAADWDWDTGLPSARDGAYANKPDEGNIYTTTGAAPYFNGENQVNNSNLNNIVSYFTANRIIPSAVMFGSLPTGVKEGVPWRTLLFRPQADRPRDPSGPKDHLLLDLFTMPVVEPYAISEPFSTAGKINMNYQIVPFTYITRSTGIRAVLGSEVMARVPLAAAKRKTDGNNYYKMPSGSVPSANEQPPGGPTLGRLPLNLSDSNGSLRQFKEKFDQWDIFRSPSEICDIYLVPQGYSWGSDSAADKGWYGTDFALVGDNVRERPYADIYPRLTTKSNTFTVHYTVQSLKNPPPNQPDKWTEGKGQIVGELRGSVTLERFLDPANKDIPDYAIDPGAQNLETHYQWRVIENSTFSP